MADNAKRLILKQKQQINHLRAFKENTNKISTENQTQGYLQGRVELLKNYFTKIQDMHDLIMDECTDTDEPFPYFKENWYTIAEDLYMGNLATLLDRIAAHKSKGEHASTKGVNKLESNFTHSSAQLPSINIPKFSGKHLDWTPFQDLFVSLIHANDTLSPVQKLHYLKLSLTGEAEGLIRNITVTADNYQVAWDKLVSRYENKRILVNAYLSVLTTLPSMTSDSITELKRILDGTIESLRALTNLGRPVDGWDDWLIFTTVSKLESTIRRDWEQSISSSTDLPTFAMLQAFLESRLRTLESLTTKTSSTANPYRSPAFKSHSRKAHHGAAAGNCLFCQKPHGLSYCFAFRKQSLEQRRAFVIKQRLCHNCLRQNHVTSQCPASTRCRICASPHHSYLHDFGSPPRGGHSSVTPPLTSKSESPACSTNVIALNSGRTAERPLILLATAMVLAKSSTGISCRARILLDQGSEISFISDSLARQLGLIKKPSSLPISGIGGTYIQTAKAVTNLSIVSRHNKTSGLTITAYILPKLTIHPIRTVVQDNWTHISGLELADEHFQKPGKIDIILGADYLNQVLRKGIVQGEINMPMAQKTIFGWVLSGPTNSSQMGARKFTQATSLHISNHELSNQLRRFWELEELYPKAVLTQEEKLCEDHFKNTHYRNSDGRYVVRLPPRTENPIQLGSSRETAVKCLLSLEKRFERNPEFSMEYKKFLQEYYSLNHMVPASSSDQSPPIYYIPHHGIIKATSTTTKLRVVFNASSATSNGLSLNAQLNPGPKLQKDLPHILLRWRKYFFAYCADIEKMFRQILVNENDQNLQRIVWRSSPSEPIQDFKLRTVTYGTACAPYLALKVFQQLSIDEAVEFPHGSMILSRDFYVDDVLSGAHSLPEALRDQGELITLLRKGGFCLRKWISNTPLLLENVPEEHRELSPIMDVNFDNSVKTLGVVWYPTLDEFGIKVSLPAERTTVTKRVILSEIARLFDPMGWLAPTIVIAKILLQRLWLIKLDWDEILPPSIAQEWLSYRQQLPHLDDIRIPRWLGIEDPQGCFEIHGFCDASTTAYAAVIYLKVGNTPENTVINLLSAVTRVAPIKVISVPRLELCGALLLARLLSSVVPALQLPHLSCHAWSDSTVVLSWLQSHPSKWKTFIANRIAEIQEIQPNLQWRHVSTTSNPADCATRGISPSDLLNHDIWWHGPEFLSKPRTQWPKGETDFPPNVDLKERTIANSHPVIVKEEWELLKRCSSLNKLLNVTAYVLRFVHNLRCLPHERQHSLLTVDEISTAKVFWIKHVQSFYFKAEIDAVKTHKEIRSKSSLLLLNPFLDTDGILRVGGRLTNANMPYNEQHPIILPKESFFSILVIRRAHATTLHGGVQLMLNYLRSEFWIVNARNLVRSIVYKCVPCFRQKKIITSQLMADLPPERVNPSRPFEHTGVDYAGPIALLRARGRGPRTIQKGYIALFVCFATKAVHIELVSDMTTSAFLAAYKRFVARRGLCRHMYSDNGTNFIGASNELKANLQALQKAHNEEMASTLANQRVQWHFIPPAAPHFGGLWEAGVKSVKHHLKRVIGAQTLTFEEFSTFLAQIEACLNSRPLCVLNDNPLELKSLSPGHFLIGSAPITVAEPSTLEINTNRLTRWELVQNIYQHFWQKWSKEYLHNLQQRHKWTTRNRPLSVGDVVLLRDDNLPPTRWSLGRIKELHPGKDGLVRVVTIQTASSTFVRPVIKLCRLPVTDELRLTTP